MAALDRDGLDGAGHMLDRDGDKALGQIGGRHRPARRRRDLGGQGVERLGHHLGVQRFVPARPEHGRKELRSQLAQQDIAIGDRQGAAAAIGGWSGHRACALRPDPQARAVEAADRAPARRDRLDRQHGRPQPHACDHAVGGPLVLARIVGDVGRGAAHVEAHDVIKARFPPRRRHPDHPARRSRQDGVLATKGVSLGQSAVRLHEEQGRRLAQFAPHLIDIAAQHGRQIGVGNRRIPSPDELDQGADLVADGDLIEARFRRDLGQPHLVGRPTPAVDQDDGHGRHPRRSRRRQVRPRPVLVQGRQHRPVHPDPLGDLDHGVIEGRLLDDVTREDVGPALPSDPQNVSETGGDGQDRRRALAFQQSVGRDRRAHPHRLDQAVRQRPRTRAQHAPHPLHGRIGIVFGVLGEQLGGLDHAIRPARHHVGEGAAPVDPEAPAGVVDGVHRRGRAHPRIRRASPRQDKPLVPPSPYRTRVKRAAVPVWAEGDSHRSNAPGSTTGSPLAPTNSSADRASLKLTVLVSPAAIATLR